MKTKILTILMLVFASVVWGQNNMFVQVSPHYENKTMDTIQILRIENTLVASWSGVSSCGEIERMKRNTDEKAIIWIKDKLFEHRESKWIRYGWYYETPNVRESKEPWPSNKRSCTGNVKFVAFIEFEN